MFERRTKIIRAAILNLNASSRSSATRHGLAEAGGKAVKIIHLLLYELPPDQIYRVIFMRRNINEVVASQQKMLRRSGRQPARK